MISLARGSSLLKKMSNRKRSSAEFESPNVAKGPRPKRIRVTYNADTDMDVDDDIPAARGSEQVKAEGLRLWNAVVNYKDPK